MKNSIYKQKALVRKGQSTIKIAANSTFDLLNSDIKESIFVWLYHIKVINSTSDPIKLTNGYWEIFDKYGRAELEDKALVDNPYIIKPGHISENTNIIRLFSDSGIILGKYFFLNLQTNEEISVIIEAVSLDDTIKGKNWN